MKDGEKGNLQGELFHDSCRSLVEQLGYSVMSEGTKDAIDLIANPPKSQNFLKPEFSPMDITAFEFKSGFQYNDNEIEKFSKKINNYKKHKLGGGIIISDLRIEEKSYKKSLIENIFLWDVRDLCFLSSKLVLINKMKLAGSVREDFLEKDITFLLSPHHTSIDSKQNYTGDIVLFFHNPLVDVDLKMLEKTVQNLNTILLPRFHSTATLPLKLGLEIHSRGFLRKDVISKISSKLTSLSDSKTISYSLKNMFTYYIAPWKVFLT